MDTLFSPRHAAKLSITNTITINQPLDTVWSKFSDLSVATQIMIPDAKVSGSGEKDKMAVEVVLTDQETFKLKVFDLNEKKNKLSYIVVGEHYMFSTYKCTISLVGDDDKQTSLTVKEIGNYKGGTYSEDYADTAKKRIALIQKYYES
eukprot:gene1234-11323_t